VSGPEERVMAAMAAKRENAGEPPGLPAPGLPGHGEAMAAGRESYPPGQRGE
jgi:hypothetical protein